MPRYTLSQFKGLYSWPEFLNLDSGDPRWLLILNEAVERLMNAGLWCGTYQRYRVCTRDACLTWPRAFQTIEVVDVCGSPMTVRNQWFEFLDQGPGLWTGGQNCSGGGPLRCPTYNYLDRGRGYVMFDDTRAAASKLRFTTQFAADAGKVINVRGYDSTGQWVLTNGGNTVGEDVTLINGSVDTTTEWGPQVFREVIKAPTKGFVTVDSYDVVVGDSVLYPMARWEPGETVPDYRRCVIPALRDAASGATDAEGEPCPPTVTVMAKLAFIPLESDLDILPLTNGPAIKLAMISVQKQERGDYEGARIAMNGVFDPISRRMRDGAIPLLNEELEVFNGAGAVAPLRLERGLDNAGVLNFI